VSFGFVVLGRTSLKRSVLCRWVGLSQSGLTTACRPLSQVSHWLSSFTYRMMCVHGTQHLQQLRRLVKICESREWSCFPFSFSAAASWQNTHAHKCANNLSISFLWLGTKLRISFSVVLLSAIEWDLSSVSKCVCVCICVCICSLLRLCSLLSLHWILHCSPSCCALFLKRFR